MILFLGNMLSKHGLAPAMTELLAKKLAVNYHVTLASSRLSTGARALDMVIQILRNVNRCSLVVIDVFSTSAFWYAVVCSRLLRIVKIPYVTVLRGGNLPIRLRRYPFFSSWVFGDAALNISPSLYLQRALLKQGFIVDVVPNFIDIQMYPFKHRDRVRPRLLWVRSFHQTYNPCLAIEVLRLLVQKYSDAQLCMIGPEKDDSLKIAKEMVVTNGLQAHVKFTGKLSKSEWVSESTNFDIFINTTNFDNMPVSLLEAMALGFPVISTDVGGIPDLIKEGSNGFMVPRDNAEEFVKRIEELINDSVLCSALSRTARSFAETYSWEQVMPQWVRTIESTKRR